MNSNGKVIWLFLGTETHEFDSFCSVAFDDVKLGMWKKADLV